jgi:ABC-type polysaccharide/polyol phosphate transport system ATPase subunit
VTPPPAIEVRGVSKRFRLVHERNSTLKATIFSGLRRTVHEDLWALEDVSFQVPKGSTFGVIGHNGSGKSTMLKCLARIYRPDTGDIEIRGRMSALLELGAGFHPELSGRENVYLNGSILGLSTRQVNERFDEIVDFSGLERFIDSPVKNYSSGMFVRLGFAVAINVEPEVLLVDEVLAVGDESFQQRCLEKFAELRRAGNTIVVVTHSLDTVRNLCDEAVWLDHGHLLRSGPAGAVADAYLDSVQQERRSGQVPAVGIPAGADVVQEVQVLGGDGEATDAVPFGQVMSIAARLAAADGPRRLRIDLHRTDGIHVAGAERLLEAGPARDVAYQVPHLLLSPATYDISVHVYDAAGACIADLARTRRFDVAAVPNHETHGLVSLGGTWVADAPEQAGSPS